MVDSEYSSNNTFKISIGEKNKRPRNVKVCP